MSEASPFLPDGPAPVGARLRAERERRGVSLEKAADDLRLDTAVAEAMEADDFGRVGPPVFVKGHLRRYAGLLGLPPAELVAGYEALALAPRHAPVPLKTARREVPPVATLRWPPLAVAALVLVGLGALWLKPWRMHGAAEAPPLSRDEPASGGAGIASSPAIDIVAAPANAPIPAAARSVGARMATGSDTGHDADAASAARAVSPAAGSGRSSLVHAVAHVAAASPPLGTVPLAPAALPSPSGILQGAGRARLKLSFSADSWVDVHDAAGRQIFAGNGRANSVKTLSGNAPMHVYLRSASGVQLEINSRAVAIGRKFVAGDVARFEAGADGVLRRELAPPASASAARPTG